MDWCGAELSFRLLGDQIAELRTRKLDKSEMKQHLSELEQRTQSNLEEFYESLHKRVIVPFLAHHYMLNAGLGRFGTGRNTGKLAARLPAAATASLTGVRCCSERRC